MGIVGRCSGIGWADWVGNGRARMWGGGGRVVVVG